MNYIKIKLDKKDWKEIAQNTSEFIFKNPLLISISLFLVFLMQKLQPQSTENPVTFIYLYSLIWFCIIHHTNIPAIKTIDYVKQQLKSVAKITILVFAAGILSSSIAAGIIDIATSNDLAPQTPEITTTNYKFLVSISILLAIISIGQGFIFLFVTMIIFTKYIMQIPIAIAIKLTIKITPRNLLHLVPIFLARGVSQFPILPTGLLLIINVICDTIIVFMIIKMFGIKKVTKIITKQEEHLSRKVKETNK